MWYIYTMECYSAIKKNKIMPFAATWMDVEPVIQSEVSKKEKNKYCMLTHIYRIFRKMTLKNQIGRASCRERV